MQVEACMLNTYWTSNLSFAFIFEPSCSGLHTVLLTISAFRFSALYAGFIRVNVPVLSRPSVKPLEWVRFPNGGRYQSGDFKAAMPERVTFSTCFNYRRFALLGLVSHAEGCYLRDRSGSVTLTSEPCQLLKNSSDCLHPTNTMQSNSVPKDETMVKEWEKAIRQYSSHVRARTLA